MYISKKTGHKNLTSLYNISSVCLNFIIYIYMNSFIFFPPEEILGTLAIKRPLVNAQLSYIPKCNTKHIHLDKNTHIYSRLSYK